jgi:hypothetical protein
VDYSPFILKDINGPLENEISPLTYFEDPNITIEELSPR